MSDQVRQEALRSKTQQLLQGPLKHVKAAALAAALVPLAVVAVRSAAPDGMCGASAGACGFVFVDTNGNGIQDAGEQPYGVWTDTNHNGTIDIEWVDANANGHVDGKDEWVDVNHNGVLDAGEWIDLNHDGILDKGEGWVDFNGNGVVDAGEWIDLNHNGVLDADEWIDLNSNGVPDAGEGWVDFNGDDTLTKSEWTDLNGNGLVDASEWQGAVVTLTQTDCTTGCITLTTSTDQYGKFEFPGSEGTFTVSVQIPPGFTASPSNNPDAPDETFDSDGVPNAAGTSSVVEGLKISGPEAVVDFGFVPKVDAVDDTGAVVQSSGGGTSVTNVLANDTLSGVPVTSGQVTLTQVSSTNAGVNLSGTDVVVAPGTPAGTYTVVYQICEVSTTNCDTASVTVPVRSIDAVDDAGAVVDGRVGGTSYANVLVNDTLNGVLVASVDVTTTQVSSNSPGVTLDGTSVKVAAGTAPGDYALVYQICDLVDPSLCDTATVSVPVRSIDAINDVGTVVNGSIGGVSYANVLVNDTLNGTPVVSGQVITTFVSSSNPGVTLSGTSVVVAAGTPAGNYTLVYRICDQLNTWICDTASVSVPVTVPVPVVVDAVNDTGASVNGSAGGTSYDNVLANDTLNGVPVTTSTVNTSFVSSTNPGVTLSGTSVVVAAGTPAGNYTLTYQICDTLNPTHCDTATVTVTVTQLGTLVHGDTATIGFWHNQNGQAIILAANGGPTAKNLATWLATSYPYLFGSGSTNNLTGKTNVDVAALFMTFFNKTGAKTDAQVMGAALAVYVTNSALYGGSGAAGYGFNVSTSGIGGKLYNVGAYGTAIGLLNNTNYTILQLLAQANLRKQQGLFNANAFNQIFDAINTSGDIK